MDFAGLDDHSKGGRDPVDTVVGIVLVDSRWQASVLSRHPSNGLHPYSPRHLQGVNASPSSRIGRGIQVD